MESIIELQHCHPTTSALDAVIPKYVEQPETASFARELSARENHFDIDMNICNHIRTRNECRIESGRMCRDYLHFDASSRCLSLSFREYTKPSFILKTINFHPISFTKSFRQRQNVQSNNFQFILYFGYYSCVK